MKLKAALFNNDWIVNWEDSIQFEDSIEFESASQRDPKRINASAPPQRCCASARCGAALLICRIELNRRAESNHWIALDHQIKVHTYT